jgi:hypothetical protein
MYRAVLAFAALSCSSPDAPTLIASATNSASAITPRDTEPVNAETWTPDMAGGPYIVKRPREVPIASPMAVSGTPQDPTFWSQFVGTTPGDRPRAFAELCARGGRNVQAQQIAPGIRILVERAGLSCTLLVNEDPALPEAGAVVDALEKLSKRSSARTARSSRISTCARSSENFRRRCGQRFPRRISSRDAST